jgi:hypothetical protein
MSRPKNKVKNMSKAQSKKNTSEKGGEKNMAKVTRKPGERVQVSRAKRVNEKALVDAVLDAIERRMARDGITKPDLAKRLDVSLPNVYQLLDRERAMTLRSLSRIAQAVGCTVTMSLKAAA